jgi:small subunit ribosomal protein S16
VGKKHQASFRMVLQDRQWKPSGKALELLGFYNPTSKEKQFQAERIKFWISKGAQPSPTLHNMFIDAKIIEGEKIKAWKPKKAKEGAKVEGKKGAKKEVAQIASDATDAINNTVIEEITEVPAEAAEEAPKE